MKYEQIYVCQSVRRLELQKKQISCQGNGFHESYFSKICPRCLPSLKSIKNYRLLTWTPMYIY